MDLKKMREKRNTLMDEMDALFTACESGDEVRAFTEDESKRFSEIETEVRALDAQIAAIEKRNELDEGGAGAGADGDPAADEKRTLDEKNFLEYMRGETRALDIGQNGAVIPAHIANRIIETVKELSPIYAMATVFNVGGDLLFPVYDESESSVSAAFVEDMQELTEGTGKFVNVRLENYIVGCLAKISKSLMNRTDFDLLWFIISKVAQKIAEFLEEKLIQGTPGKNDGVLSAKQVETVASDTVLTADDLIDLQMSVVQQYQKDACWIMHKMTLKAVRKLKDNNGDYMLNQDIRTPFGWSILGKPVYITDSMPKIEAGKPVIAYGDMKGLFVKLAQGIELQLLVEKYATQHALGVVGYVEFDSRIVEPQKISVLEMAAGG